MESIGIDVRPDEVGIISLKPPTPVSPVGEVRAEDGFALVGADGVAWQLRFFADGEPVGVMSCVLISPEEVEVVQVPGGPVVTRVELIPVHDG